MDDNFEYRFVYLPKAIYKTIPREKLLSEDEWRSIGIIMSKGWKHYHIHSPEPYILYFRRALGTDPLTGEPPAGFDEASIL